MARICGECQGKGKFEAHVVNIGGGKVAEIPERKCYTCDGKGIISAPQIDGHEIYGAVRNNSLHTKFDEVADFMTEGIGREPMVAFIKRTFKQSTCATIKKNLQRRLPVNKITWYVKQIFPLTYWTTYGDSEGGHFVIWRMWLGRCFSITDIVFRQSNALLSDL